MADYRTRLNIGPQRTDVYFAASDVGLVPSSGGEHPVLALKTDGSTCGWISAKFTPYDGTKALRVSVEKAPDDDENLSRSSDTIFFYSDGADTSSTANAFFEIGNIEQSYLPGSSGCLSATETALLGADTPSASVGVYMVDVSSPSTPKLGIAKGANAVAEVELGSVDLGVLGGSGGHVVSYNLRSGVTETDDCLVVVDETSTDGYAPLRLATRIYYGIGENSDVSSSGVYDIVYPEASSGSSTTAGEFVVDPTTMSVPASGGSFSYLVPSRSTTGSSISVSSGVTWMTAESLGEGDSAGLVVCSENTDSSDRVGVLTLTEQGGTYTSQTITVTQAAAEYEEDEWTGMVPAGNASGGGMEDAPTVSGSGTRVWWRGIGEDEMIRAESDVSGGVDPEGGESWRVTFKMRRDRAKKFIKTKALFINSTWQPVSLPSRNMPVISGWEVSYQGPIATVEIKYELKAGGSYSYSTSDAPVESIIYTGGHSTVERPLSECSLLFGGASSADDVRRNAALVQWMEKIATLEPWNPNYASDLEKIGTALGGSGLGVSVEDLKSHPAFACVQSGQTTFLAYTATFTLEETRNSMPVGVGSDVGSYSNPPSEAKGPGMYWLLTEDSVSHTSGGQYVRRRVWQNAEVKSPTYGG